VGVARPGLLVSAAALNDFRDQSRAAHLLANGPRPDHPGQCAAVPTLWSAQPPIPV
jgi:hypothetical protein